MSTLVGKNIGKYQVLSRAGKGGMAVVYKARLPGQKQPVAVKVIQTEHLPQSGVARALKRFEREARALGRLDHPNIVKILDYGEHEGKPFLVMPYLTGGTLKEKINGQPMPWLEAIRLALPVARALVYAHGRHMIHRDVKPANILLDEDSQPLLSDFGIAKILDEEVTMDLTDSRATVGTPEYMAPEQVTSKTVDARADIYSLGVVLYEMITGRRPFQADTPIAVMVKHASEALPPPSGFVSNLPRAVETMLIQALAKKPQDRFEDMAAFLFSLEVLAGERSADQQSTDAFATVQQEQDGGTVDRLEDSQETIPEPGPAPAPSNARIPVPPPLRPTPDPGLSGGLGIGLAGLGVLGICLVGAVIGLMILFSGGNGGVSDTGDPATNTPRTSSSSSSSVTVVQPTQTPTRAAPTSTSLPSCPGADWQPRVEIGDEVRVCTIYRLLLRDQPAGSQMMVMYPDTTLTILDGPYCADSAWWWRVQVPRGTKYAASSASAPEDYSFTTSATTGYVREGIDREKLPASNGYFLCR